MLSIKQLQAALTQADIPCSVAPFPGVEVPYVVLGPEADPLVVRGLVAPEQARVGGLVFLNDILQAAGQPTAKLDCLQLTLTLNFDVPPACIADCHQLLAAINQRLLLGNLGLNSAGAPYFRYHWQIFERQLIPATVVTAVRLAYQQTQDYGACIQGLALGEMRLATALESL